MAARHIPSAVHSGPATSSVGGLVRPILIAVVVCLISPLVARAQADPVLQLQHGQPRLFADGQMQPAALWGRQAVRLVTVSPEQEQLGFHDGDVVIAVQGLTLGGADLPPLPDQPVYTVVRRVAGERPVLDASTIGRRMLQDFVDLEASEQTPMRFSRMVANAWTLMQQGQGVLLLPQAVGSDDSAWLRFATPLPAPSEEGIERVAEGIRRRAQLPVVPDEAEAARRAFEADDVLVAQERASRALLQWIVEPSNRRQDPRFTALVTLYRDATVAVAERRAELLKPAPQFGVFVEGSYSFIQKMLPQETLIAVENSHGGSGRAGVRTRVFRWLDLQASYGYLKNDFKDVQGRTKISNSVQPLLLELAYRPIVLSRLKPVFRAGVGWYFLDTEVRRDDGVAAFKGSRNTWGLECGGGIDAFYWKSQALRGTIQVGFRWLEYTFAACPQDPGDEIACDTENWPDAANLPPGSNYDPSDPLAFLRPLPPKGDYPHYTYNLNGWMLGFMLTRNF
jgi:hypothetical protein